MSRPFAILGNALATNFAFTWIGSCLPLSRYLLQVAISRSSYLKAASNVARIQYPDQAGRERIRSDRLGIGIVCQPEVDDSAPERPGHLLPWFSLSNKDATHKIMNISPKEFRFGRKGKASKSNRLCLLTFFRCLCESWPFRRSRPPYWKNADYVSRHFGRAASLPANDCLNNCLWKQMIHQENSIIRKWIKWIVGY